MKQKIFPLLVLGAIFLAVPVSQAHNNMTGNGFSNTDIVTYSVGILGSSVNGWDVDVDMISTDNVNYTLTNFALKSGFVKFRQDNTWDINWGGDSFPYGTGYQNGPDILITDPGNYNINFNRETGEYLFTVVLLWEKVGITGTAVSPDYDWVNSVNMSTADGITYTLAGRYFKGGKAKFRQMGNLSADWGSLAFPSGIARLNGLGIPVKAGSYSVTFNLQTGEFHFVISSIGILGSALSGWTDDIDLRTMDGINYSLINYPFSDGEVKFRQDDSWDVNWGGYEFPSGNSWQDGPNIPVPVGTFNVFFNRITTQYNFVATTCPIAGIKCPENLNVGNSPGICGAYVYYPDIVAAPNCGGKRIRIERIAGLPSGALFPPGTTTNTYRLTNSSGNTATCSFDVTVNDWEPPVIQNLKVFPALLWPANHKMVPVTVSYQLFDNCRGKVQSELSVWSNETDEGCGDGHTEADWKVIDPHHLLLRAESSDYGTGREYHIIVMCWDKSWNIVYGEVIVKVPNDPVKLKAASVLTGNTFPDHSVLSITPVQSEQKAGTMPFTVKVWPNPGEQYFNLDLQTISTEKTEFSLFDSTGRIISQLEIGNKQPFRFGEGLKPGIYIVTIKQGDNFRYIKVVKQ